MKLRKSYPKTIEIVQQNFKVLLPEIKSTYIDVDDHLGAISIHLESEEKVQQLEKLILKAPEMLQALLDVKEWFEEMDRSSDRTHLRYITALINEVTEI
ncbi:hypothetical protein [Flavobacterium sp.]|uniref:hypothetical protein n=1 Tax=Flavobacterium sp. TaxID=239 RepID=UPI00262C47C4|nr:hypothetical protein [Flavobacterium sp.]